MQIEPAFGTEGTPVVFATDVAYARYMAVAIRSAIASRKSAPLDVIVLCEERSEKGLNGILRREFTGLGGVSVRVVGVPQARLDAFGLDAKWAECGAPVSQCLRVVAPEVLERYSRFVYLDCDLVVRESLDELYHADLGGNILGAVADLGRSLHPPTDPALVEWAQKNGIDDWSAHFNSGVMVVDAEAFRRERLAPRLVALAAEAAKWCVDQEALNAVCKGRVKFLDARWNCQVGYYCLAKQVAALGDDEPFIVHFLGGEKPWRTLDHPFGAEWWRFAGEDAATFFGAWRDGLKPWRESKAPRGMAEVARLRESLNKAYATIRAQRERLDASKAAADKMRAELRELRRETNSRRRAIETARKILKEEG